MSMPVPYHQPRPLGPMPPPLEPQYYPCLHVLHAVLTFFTFGLWLPVWLIAAHFASRRNRGARMHYEAAYRAWQQDYWRWQHGR